MDQDQNKGGGVKCEVQVSGLAGKSLGVVFEGCLFFFGGGGVRVMRGLLQSGVGVGDGCFFFCCVFFFGGFWWKFLKIIPSYHAGSMENDPMKKVPREASHSGALR